ncbi:degradation in the endoplasmic reticulum protein 1 [Kluyveromyces marxianus]|uniref:Derlin n=2 Tax=Kluyveromyces marxianus TaxID=4911 RepID=W0T5Q8_KLUMD|nr:degradation in the endoplasmic reticulum protein 1 [Kluyveromyces marxianus DMKU3-1042]QGN13449.1 degradation in the endoplasmic reticulum protein 1 [Kluyveromyces marxianus]BAO38373.1 degradation in the endoplasmic reticulum protein 1 [Kluyveromyces marxianus DMKU3-1042]BAP69931.1 degradation in the endoplasmic reticulum protein 1 [Kluyveromyces marxianus]
MDLLPDLPPITKYYLYGTIAMAIARHYDLLSIYDVLYSWDLVYHKKQYLRLVYALFDLGLSSTSMLFTFTVISSLKEWEQSAVSKRRFAIQLIGMYLVIISISIYTELPHSVGGILGFNIWYYVTKKSRNIIHLGDDLEIRQAWLPILSMGLGWGRWKWNTLQLLSVFLPGHLVYFFNEAMQKTYGFEI